MSEESNGSGKGGGVNLGRHRAQCKICCFSDSIRERIEEEFISRTPLHWYLEEYGIVRDTLYRHAHAVGLFGERRKYLSRVLEMIIDRGERSTVSTPVVISAVKALAKMDPAGKSAEPVQQIGRAH